MAKETGTECGIIDNTFTEPIGKFETDEKGINLILEMLHKSYELQREFPIED